MDKIIFFDTTLRDGEQAPGCQMNENEKVAIARQLQRLGVDVIEAGFPASSNGEFRAVSRIAEEIGADKESPTICALARALESDVKKAYEALKNAKNPRIHYFISTSPLHMEKKLRKTPEEVITQAVRIGKYIRETLGIKDIEFSAEDATRSHEDFLCKIFEKVIEACSRDGTEKITINIPDTVGFSYPDKFVGLINYIRKNTKNIDRAILSVHCHNDRGLAVANTLEAVRKAGVKQVEVTVNGIGERAGNASLEQIVGNFMLFGYEHNINTKLIKETSELVSRIVDIEIQPNTPIVGKNAFSHQSGIHQDGMLKDAKCYEIFNPYEFGCSTNLSIGARSGKRGFMQRIKNMGLNLTKEEVDRTIKRFMNICDSKKNIDDVDILIAINGKEVKEYYRFIKYFPKITNRGFKVEVVLNEERSIKKYCGIGNGLIDAAINAVKKSIKTEGLEIKNYLSKSKVPGSDATAYTYLEISKGKYIIKSSANHTDTITSAILAFIDCANRAKYFDDFFKRRK